MPKRFLQLDDLQNTNNPEQVAALFKKLGYNAACQLLDIRDLELPERSIQDVNRVYLIANQGNADLQVFLFQLHHKEGNFLSAVTNRMREITKSLCKRPSYFLLLGTKDYKQYLLVSPRQSFDAQMNLKLSIHEYLLNVANPSYHDLNRLEQLANRNLDPQKLHIIQHETLRFRNKQKQSDEKDSVRIYLQEIGRIPLLKADEEIELARRATNLEKLEIIREQLQEKLQRNPQHEELANAVGISSSELRERLYSKNKLIEANLRLVVSVAKKYTNRGIDLLDLIQEGNLGLIRAVEKFDYTKGYKLSTYATLWIKQGITRSLADQSRTIRLPVHLRETISRIKKTTKQLSQELSRIPNTKEIATRLEMTTEKLRSIVSSALPLISLDTRIGEEEDSSLADLIEFDGETPERYLLKIDEREDLKSLLDNLSPREQNVLLLLYGVNDEREKSLEAVGKIFHLTRERIRQIKNQAFSKLKTHINRKIREAQVITKMAVTVKRVYIQAPKDSLEKSNVEARIMNQDDKSSVEHNENKLNQKKLTDQQLKLTEMRDKKMIISKEELLEKLTSIESVFSQLHAQLAKASLDLIEPGIPIPEKLILEISDSRKNFIELRAKVLYLAESVGVSTNSSQIDSLEEIKSLLLIVAQAEEQKLAIAQVRQKAQIVLERVLAIAHRVENNFQPLLECQEKAREFYLSISESQGSHLPPDAQILVDGNHPFSHLLTLIEHGKKLDDEAFTKLEDSVEEFFSKALSVPASRGKLIITDYAPSVKQLTVEIDNKALPEKTIKPTVETALTILSEETRKEFVVAPFLEAKSNESQLLVYAPPDNTIPPEQDINKARIELEEAINETRKKLENDVALGLLGEAERLAYATQIDSIENTTRTIVFSEKILQLQALDEEIKKQCTQKIKEYRQEVLQEIEVGHPEYNRISRVLDIGDILTANEYIDMVRNKQAIPEQDKKRDAFLDFFQDKYADIERVLERHQTKKSELINNIAKGKNIGPIQMQHVPGAQSKKAAEMLDTWLSAKGRKQGITQKDVDQILTNLGFNSAQIAIKKAGNYTWIDITTEAIQDKNRCPVPAYGSQTQGRYRILCVWERPTEEDILNAVGDTSSGSGVLVFHFGRMTEKRRRDLARLCRERRRTFIVIDDTLMFYLCGERGARLPVLFDCTLPFTFLEPYTPNAEGLVPSEMFYGREPERQSIINTMGSCLIYGGRKLGKTALLLYVQRNFNVVNQENIASFLDIKPVGLEKPLDNIWSILVEELEKLQILDTKRRNPPNYKTLQQIKSWLEVDNQRRILLLLDEADNFLEADGKEGFPRCNELRRLMLETNRRFKVVFAGLHNVQRTTKLQNHPLAHFGEPICIGPLLNNGEMREARALIERPFSSIGYRFESPDLITRILSHTNYYPSLIQLYCQQLLKHVTNPDFVTFDDKPCPPFLITSQQVDDAYNNQDLRKAIRDRFMLTLQLDRRYEVIAYSIAYGTLESENRLIDGFSVSWIRKEVLTWWYEGFQWLSLDEIQVLLEEMVGLGVLRETNIGWFTLRSRNVLLLMGTLEEIEAALLNEREFSVYEPATFRSSLGIKDDSRRSPLTDQQKSKLHSSENGVSIIYGCKATGIDELKIFLESMLGNNKEFFHYLDDIVAEADFSQHLKHIIRNRQKDNTTLVFVPSQVPWDNDWVDEAIQQVRKLRAKNSFVRVVFIADPQIAWQLISKNTTKFDEVNKLTIFSLKPWHDAALRQWLEDCNFPSDKVVREKITAVTGNWPTLLQRFYQNYKSDLHNWELHLQELKDLLNDSQEARNFALQLGIDRQQRKVLRVLAELSEISDQGKVSIDDLVDFLEDIQPEIVNKILNWADLLSLASPVGNDLWCINTVVGAVLQSIGE